MYFTPTSLAAPLAMLIVEFATKNRESGMSIHAEL
jgi:hypothetical protein